MKNFQLKKTVILLVVFSLLVIPLVVVKAIDQPGDPFYGWRGEGVDTCGGSTVSCPGGGGNNSYSQGSYYSQSAYAPVGMQISVNPQLISTDGTTTLTWKGGDATSCTVTGKTVFSTALTGSLEVGGFTNQTVFTLTCMKDGLSKTITTSVKTLPQVHES